MDYRSSSVLITGGTGSFGRAMTKHLLGLGCGRIRILSRDEAKQDAMRSEFSDDALQFYIGDVRSRKSVDEAMKGVDYVFHAAALKQVPSCEFFPLEAVKTNVLGSSNVIDAAIDAGVKQAVCLSTDKAVLPINAMGMSKALMEKTVQAATRRIDDSETVISCVRYGNVLFSRGSVIPLFIGQIKQGRPITITDPHMTRFLLALGDAVKLVEFAFANARPGDLFVKKAPACTVEDLARALLDLFGATNEVKIIGMRHGEKLYETLATAEELRRADDMEDYFRIAPDNRDLNYAKYFTEGDNQALSLEDYHSHNTTRLSQDEVRDLLRELPEVSAELES